ncbi:6-phosphogluconate dehydrogenase C-terminal domain-like protein [Violaceomyces palustris]|uniref:6-phosphogluconate dehydrogenase C-terminal domain-like protein n=1 Tax=Violaceomyces palustris TaxID=1673888 RepID=A0ACD0NXM5_9BASI|nr:6-phosphogluconate dehydrogenase C-terminal domain-like protein [Violaceomyces palustris]
MSNFVDNIPYSSPSTPHPQHQIGWVGLGNMGSKMALNLSKHLQTLSPPLPPLLVWNRTSSKAKDLEKKSEGACKAVGELEDLAQRCDLIFTSLSEDTAAEEVYTILLVGEEKRVGKGTQERISSGLSTVFVDTSTLYPETTGKLERQVSALPKRHFVAAPAFGPPPMAEAAKLVFAVAGPYNSKKHVSQFLVPAMGRKIMDFGSNPERAASFKLIGNSIIISTIEMLSETMTLADKTGVGSERLYEFLEEFYPAPSALGYGKKIMTNNFQGENGFTLEGGIKDASHIRRLGDSVDCPLPIIDLARQHMISARAHGGSHLDWSSLSAGFRITAGVPPFERPEMLQKQPKQ